MKALLQRYDTVAGKFFMAADIINVSFFLVTFVVWLWDHHPQHKG